MTSFFSIKHNFRSLFSPPTTSKRFAVIDGLRAIAILWLILFHSIWVSGFFYNRDDFQQLTQRIEFSWIIQGHLGVDIFFVISGFLIGYILLKEIKKTGRLRFKRFYLRRALRILPAYFFTLLLLALLTSKNTDNLWTNVLFINNFLPIKDQFMLWSWSLAIEEQFYLFCPLLLLWLYRRNHSIISIFLGLFIASFVIRYVILAYSEISQPLILHPVVDKVNYYQFFDTLYDKTYTRFGGLLLGVLTAALYIDKRLLLWLQNQLIWRRLFLLLSSCIVITFIVVPWFWINKLSDHVFSLSVSSYRHLFSLAIAYFIFYCFTDHGKKSWLSRCLSAKYWYPIAQLSYSAFLINMMIIFTLGKTLYFVWPAIHNPYNIVPTIIIFLITTFSISVLMYLFIEKPCMNLR